MIGREENEVEHASSYLFSLPTTVTCVYHAREQSSFLNELRTNQKAASVVGGGGGCGGGGGGDGAAAAAMEEAPVGSFGVHQQSAQVPLFFLKIKWNGFRGCS